MSESSYTVEAIEAAPNHAHGHRWTPEGTTEVPFSPICPYHVGGAGDINSTLEDMVRWLRLHLGNGTFEGRPLVSAQNLAVTRTPKVALGEQQTYALGWVNLQTPNGRIVWHNGDAITFGSMVAMVPDRNVGVIILTNEANVGCPDELGLWVLDRILDNPMRDRVADKLKTEKASFEKSARRTARPASPRSCPPLAPLAGKWINPSFGAAALSQDGDALVLELQATGARLKLMPWDGDIFLTSLMPIGQFGPIADFGTVTPAFVQFQIDKDGKLNLLRLSFDDGQAYEFRRE